MNIVVFGAGAIGSLFGAILSKDNNVTLIGRKDHVKAILQKGITIEGKTSIKKKIPAFEKVQDITSPDLLILSVKSYDTKKAMDQIKNIIGGKTIVMSLQNGLDNVEIIKKYVKSEKIAVCITTHGAYFSRSGIVIHTGIGKTAIGNLEGKNNQEINHIVKMFNASGITSTASKNIIREMWVKGIINSSINPLTTYFNCKNGYLLENPILERLVEKICEESSLIAISNKISVDYEDVLSKTKEVIMDTKDNFSSMLQSYGQGKKTEIDSINGIFVKIGKKNKESYLLNEILTCLIKK